MNRLEAIAELKKVATPRVTVHGAKLGTGFFFGDAVHALKTFERASRILSTLIKNHRVLCRPVVIGGTSHDFYVLAE